MSEPLKQCGSSACKSPQPVKPFFPGCRISLGRSKAFIVESLQELFKHKKIMLSACFLYNCLSSNWRGEFRSVLGRAFGTGSDQKAGSPHGLPTAWSSEQRWMPACPSLKEKGKSNKSSSSNLDGREHSFSFPVCGSGADMIYQNMAYNNIHNSSSNYVAPVLMTVAISALIFQRVSLWKLLFAHCFQKNRLWELHKNMPTIPKPSICKGVRGTCVRWVFILFWDQEV